MQYDEKYEALRPLSPREIDVVRLIALGMTYNEISRELAITYRTVQTHISSIYKKWGIEYRTEAAVLAIGHYVALEEVQQAILERAECAVDVYR